MSQSEKTAWKEWQEKSIIDYTPVFISLWLSLNAWLKESLADTINKDNELSGRKLIDYLKGSEESQPARKFDGLLYSEKKESTTFRGYFFELYQALEDANIEFHRLPGCLEDSEDKKVSFSHTVLYWDKEQSKFESIIKDEQQDDQQDEQQDDPQDDPQDDKFEASENFYIDSNDNLVFRAYIENLYQIRCSLFHGDLPLNKENERVIRAFYHTLSMIMARV